MSATTNIPSVLLGASWRLSLAEPPPVVQSDIDASFLSSEGVLTVLQTKPVGETMTKERPPVRIPRVVGSSEPKTGRYKLLQKWDGVVVEDDEETFTARLIDSHGKLPPQQATFSRSELAPEEQNQIAVGASFVWTIGYRHTPSREKASYFYFRRLPPWSEIELKAARDRAEKASAAIEWK